MRQNRFLDSLWEAHERGPVRTRWESVHTEQLYEGEIQHMYNCLSLGCVSAVNQSFQPMQGLKGWKWTALLVPGGHGNGGFCHLEQFSPQFCHFLTHMKQQLNKYEIHMCDNQIRPHNHWSGDFYRRLSRRWFFRAKVNCSFHSSCGNMTTKNGNIIQLPSNVKSFVLNTKTFFLG